MKISDGVLYFFSRARLLKDKDYYPPVQFLIEGEN